MKDDGALDSLMLLVSAIVYHIACMECKQSFRENCGLFRLQLSLRRVILLRIAVC